jgi:hypothetical protein
LDILVVYLAGFAGDLFVLGRRERWDYDTVDRDADIDEGILLLLFIQLPTDY